MAEADRSFSLRAVSMLKWQCHKWWDFFPSVMWTEGESETARSEREKKMSEWIITIIGWLFYHTVATQLFKHLL